MGDFKSLTDKVIEPPELGIMTSGLSMDELKTMTSDLPTDELLLESEYSGRQHIEDNYAWLADYEKKNVL
jgi:hypothetical protein